MALPGFELVYSSVAPQITSSDDCLIVAVHWNLISNGLKCCGSGETWPDADRQNENLSGSESLPEGWNSDKTIYTLRYVDPRSNRKYLMKTLAVDGRLILHLVRCFDEKTVSTAVRSRDFVNEDFSTVARAFNNLAELNSTLTRELYDKVMEQPRGVSSTPVDSSPQGQTQPGRSPLMEDPRRGGGLGYTPPRQPMRPDYDPFSVGRADLDPLAGGFGGGMFMDPRNFPRPGGFQPGGPLRPNQPGFPPGSVPPGARFDPVGPPGVRPGPDPDHERPPDSYDDMFM